MGKDLSIIWLDNQHWSLVGDSAVLSVVWWLEIKGLFRGVPKGTYTPILNVSFNYAMWLEAITVQISPVSDDSASFGPDTTSIYRFASLEGLESQNGPMRIKMPVIHVGMYPGAEAYHDLNLEMDDFDSGRAKSGLTIESIILEPFSDTPTLAQSTQEDNKCLVA